MSHELIEQQMRKIIVQVGHLDEAFSAREELYALGLDSSTMIDIFMAVEQQFEVPVPDEYYVTLRSLDQFVEFLAGKR